MNVSYLKLVKFIYDILVNHKISTRSVDIVLYKFRNTIQ